MSDYQGAIGIRADGGGISFSATNGHSTAALLIQGDPSPDTRFVLVPRGNLSKLASILSSVDDDEIVTFAMTPTHSMVTASASSFTWSSSVIDGNFPDVRRYFPKEFEGEFEVDAYLLMNAVLQTRMFKDDTNQHITIASESPDVLHITSPSLERGNATAVIPASAITRDVRFSVDAVTFNAAVSACASARIWIGVNPNRSVTIRPIDGMDLTQVLAPVVKGERG